MTTKDTLRPSPAWMPEPCPAWCLADHSTDFMAADREHYGAERLVPLTLEDGFPDQGPAQFGTLLTRHVQWVDPVVDVMKDGAPVARLSLSEAQRLAYHLLDAIHDAGPSAVADDPPRGTRRPLPVVRAALPSLVPWSAPRRLAREKG